MNNDRTLYKGTIEFLRFRVTADVEIFAPSLKVSFDRVTWLDAEWAGPSTPVLDPDTGETIGHERPAKILMGGNDGAPLPGGPAPVFFRLIDVPEAPIVKGDRNVRPE